jgi:hypothetical protein
MFIHIIVGKKLEFVKYYKLVYTIEVNHNIKFIL